MIIEVISILAELKQAKNLVNYRTAKTPYFLVSWLTFRT